MAKRRQKPPENPLSADLIAAAVAPVEDLMPSPSPERAAPPAATEPRKAAASKTPPTKPAAKRPTRPQKTLRVRFPAVEYEENAALIEEMRRMMGGSKVTESDVTRALWSLARRAQETMEELRPKAPKTSRPANGDWMGKAEYDDAVAHFLHLALKRMGARD